MSAAAHEISVLAPKVAVPERTIVLKQDDTFGLFNEAGDVAADTRHEEGLYHAGTRHLSRLALKLAGAQPLMLSSGVRSDNLVLGVDLTNPDIYVNDQLVLARGSLHIYRQKLIWDGTCHERIHVRNFTRTPLEIRLSIEFAADFEDVFEVSGRSRPRRGRQLEGRTGPDFAELCYEGLDRIVRRTVITCKPAPRTVTPSQFHLGVELEGHAEQVFTLAFRCESGARTINALAYEAALFRGERVFADGERFKCDIDSSHERLNSWIHRSAADLNMLLSTTPTGLYPYAGVPWSDTTFGRDGIVTALECLWLAPHVAKGVLAFLASTQSKVDDPERDAEPGKILHEARRGEMANLGEVPFGSYYGSVDATPMFVMLAAAYWRRTGDLACIESLWPAISGALEWMDGQIATDRAAGGQGFLRYARRSSRGLLHQGWKDSLDSIFHEDGQLAPGPITLCEVQGYVYAAKLGAAQLAEELGFFELSRTLRDDAFELREMFQNSFWCEDLGTYALALDGDGRPCKVRSSNAGHCLFTEIATPEHADELIRTLSQETSFSGWGIRTLADTESRYNPMAYHNGCVWPHDNALIASGLTKRPDKDLAARVFAAQLDATSYFDFGRLPQLFCGFRRRDGKGPTRYPLTCAPQACAAGSVFALLQACLGLTIDALGARVELRYPHLPPNIERISIRGLEVGEARVDLTLYRYSGAVGVNVDNRTGQLDVAVLS
ncbi:MAG TPA: glycogen debranching N-terminal domain-containing protein [Steroidobacteraceae bacterium]